MDTFQPSAIVSVHRDLHGQQLLEIFSLMDSLLAPSRLPILAWCLPLLHFSFPSSTSSFLSCDIPSIVLTFDTTGTVAPGEFIPHGFCDLRLCAHLQLGSIRRKSVKHHPPPRVGTASIVLSKGVTLLG